MNGPKKILWDFDATLADSPSLWSRATVGLLEGYGVDGVKLEDVQPFHQRGFPWHDYSTPHLELFSDLSFWDYLGQHIQPILAHFAECSKNPDSIGLDLKEWVLANHEYRLVLEAGEVLKTLSSRGYSHIIASNHIPELDQIVDSLGIGAEFQKIYTSGTIGFEKPHPGFFDFILHQEGRESILFMVGDSFDRDVKGAERAGIDAVWFDRTISGENSNYSGKRITRLIELSDWIE